MERERVTFSFRMRPNNQGDPGDMDLAKTQPIPFGLETASPDESERRLVEAAQQGDQAAFAELVRLYDRSVLRIALRILRSPDEAQDAYQEAFLKVYRKLGTFRFQCRLHTWIYRIATNACLDQLRRRKSRPEFTTLESADEIGRSPLDLAADTSPSSYPDRMTASSEKRQRLERALEKLSDRERVVFTLRHHGGMRLREIGDANSMSEESVKQCLFRATRKLRKELVDVRD